MEDLRDAVTTSSHVKEQMFQHYFKTDRYGSDEDTARGRFKNELEHPARSQILMSGYLRQYENSINQSARHMQVQTRIIHANSGKIIIRNGLGIAVTGLVALIGSQGGNNETMQTIMKVAGIAGTAGGLATMLLGYVRYRV